jgi:hypothetical protein
VHRSADHRAPILERAGLAGVGSVFDRKRGSDNGVDGFFGVAQNTHAGLTGSAGLFERLATNSDTLWSVALVARLWVRRPLGL